MSQPETKVLVPMMDPNQLHQEIQNAAEGTKVLRIMYHNLKNQAQYRNIEPYEIRDGKLWAYCRKNKGIRQFSLDRIQSAKPTSYSFFPKWPIKFGDEKLEKAASFANPWMYRILEPLFGPYHDAVLE